jgi:hypothetical protein
MPFLESFVLLFFQRGLMYEDPPFPLVADNPNPQSRGLMSSRGKKAIRISQAISRQSSTEQTGEDALWVLPKRNRLERLWLLPKRNRLMPVSDESALDVFLEVASFYVENKYNVLLVDDFFSLLDCVHVVSPNGS